MLYLNIGKLKQKYTAVGKYVENTCDTATGLMINYQINNRHYNFSPRIVFLWYKV